MKTQMNIYYVAIQKNYLLSYGNARNISYQARLKFALFPQSFPLLSIFKRLHFLKFLFI